jgi:hypothetical protein
MGRAISVSARRSVTTLTRPKRFSQRLEQPYPYYRRTSTLNLAIAILPYARRAFLVCTGKPMSAQQEQDLQHLCLHRKSGEAASRGYGKTLFACIIETYLASLNFLVTHIFKELKQATQWYVWMRRLGWKVSQWNARCGEWTVYLRLYNQGRGPRMDAIINDEVGTVISEIERQNFRACQEMLSGSRLGFAKYLGTRDPNSIWDKYEQNVIVRPYDAQTMPWAVMQYNDAKRHSPAWYMDQEYHMKATPAGGLLFQHCVLQDHDKKTTRYGIDVNPMEGHFVVGTCYTPDATYVTEARVFHDLQSLALFMSHQHHAIEFELEMNGPGGVVAQYLHEGNIDFVESWVTEDNKVARCTELASHPVIVKPECQQVYVNLIAQIWDENKRIKKFNDAHWFDATWHSAAAPIIWN